MHIVHPAALFARVQLVRRVLLCLLLLEADTFDGLLVRRIVRVRAVEDGSQVGLSFPLSLPSSASGLWRVRFRTGAG